MSKIAEALAKAKERTGVTTAPFGGVAPVVAETKSRRYRDTRRLWLALLFLAASGIAGLIWVQLRPATKPVAPIEPPPAVEQPVPLAPPPSVPAPPPPPALRADLIRVVNGLVISAVMPGDRPRLMMDGRIIGQDEPVDPELVFVGVLDGHVLFRDVRGAIYSRKY